MNIFSRIFRKKQTVVLHILHGKKEVALLNKSLDSLLEYGKMNGIQTGIMEFKSEEDKNKFIPILSKELNCEEYAFLSNKEIEEITKVLGEFEPEV